MNSKKLRKDAVMGLVQSEDTNEVTDEELAMINGYTRRNLVKDEVYVFSVVLCDNDIDRDGERFTVESLFALEKLFVGKTGIFDHNPTAKNQTARIFACNVEAVDGVKTESGEEYFRLKARAYIPKSEKNNELILALDSGIVREVSIGCAVGNIVCSVCGEPLGQCIHKKGESYGNKLCCSELLNPYDAYEWSFVAVPSQKKAGVVKSYLNCGKELKMEKILKKIADETEVELGINECRKLNEYIGKLKSAAKDGVFYRDTLTNEVIRLSAVIQPNISRETMESVTKSMTVAQLNEFKNAFEKEKQAVLPVPQLYSDKNKNKTVSNGQFKI